MRNRISRIEGHEFKHYQRSAFVSRIVVFALIILGLADSASSAMTITSDARGNIFPAGKTLTVTIGEAKGVVRYEVVDYFGKTLMSGSGTKILLSGLNPGWYELRCKDDAGTIKTSIGAVIDRSGIPLDVRGRIALDTIGSGSEVADIVRLAGIPWVRERFWWNVVQSGAGPIDWKGYPELADKIAVQGLHVSQVWHDSPTWLHPKNPGGHVPDDLRDIYTFSKQLSTKFAGKWDVWEIGNEPDLAWSGIGERFAGYEKAAYLGHKDGNPKAMILPASVGFGAEAFVDQIYECGLGDYCDAFNWHFYGITEQCAWNTEAYLRILKRYNADDRPIWISEGGWPLPPSVDEPNHELTAENQQVLTRTVVRNVVTAFAAGTERYFWFCMPERLERGIWFNLVKADLTPYSHFLAYSAAANIIGVSDYLGQYDTGQVGSSAYAFSTPRGTVLVAWSDKEAQIAVATDRSTVRLADTFGSQRDIKVQNGQVSVTVGPEAVYLIDIGNKVKSKLSGTVRPNKKVTPKNPSRIVTTAYTQLPVNGDRGCYCFEDADKIVPFDYTVEVYNFEQKVKKSGSLVLSLPEGWRADKMQVPVMLEPMGRQVLTFKVTPIAPETLQSLNTKVRVDGRFDGEKVSPCVSYFGFDASILPVVDRKSLDWTQSVDRWKSESSGCGNENAVNVPVTATLSEKNTIRFCAGEKKIEMGSTDIFAYMILKFKKPMNLQDYDGIAFSIKGVGKADTISLMLVETNGVAYYLSIPCLPDVRKKIVLSFQDMRWAMWFTGDPNGKLDLDDIAAIKLGRSGDNLAFEVGEFELVKFPKNKNEPSMK
jgi:hypothetical protein